ncbi:hypothetical protein [Burkholderia ubonensis]|uniref:Uncharacterized protein n=1 Tax=Burkholderia ubonensis subsp. mesacidophila TaxID=265293 RepID=A0A2A4FKG9_9BURK|nr:hypothetical protein [Burkholderia ubonensis]PCE34213.1 hypothetical protein BZL54_01215 [Burkholderia ubonensis subsp. mesacidophila]
MVYVLEMSTDADIRQTQLHVAWGNAVTRYAWAQVSHGGLNIPGGATIIVIAHGNNTEIGNANAGAVDVDESVFLATVHACMAGGAAPGRVYLSTCGAGLAVFTARVRIAATQNRVWHGVQLFGHHEAVTGPVPPPTTLAWSQIFGRREGRRHPARGGLGEGGA